MDAAGHAYVAEGHVLFSVPSMPDYGGLSKRSLDELEAGARVEAAGGVDRRDISDALGISPDGSIKEYEGVDGVVFDLGGPGVWNVSSVRPHD